MNGTELNDVDVLVVDEQGVTSLLNTGPYSNTANFERIVPEDGHLRIIATKPMYAANSLAVAEWRRNR